MSRLFLLCSIYVADLAVFLGSDASVKLGDFGLSKIMQSHDFASTYVGTPFYMSPEICAAEQYSLHSDIWAFGCIMYELCSKEPPFNAKTHMELISKIRLGKVAQLSTHYSPELRESIARCLRVNPHARPDTTQLLNIPMVKLKRKELEIVRVSKQLKTREEQASKALLEAERKIARTDIDRQAIRSELDQIVRREWEVKARLEIDRQVQLGLIELQRSFDARVNRSVAEELSRQKLCELDRQHIRSSTPDHEEMPSNIPLISHHQSQSTCGETDDFPSSTDLSELSLESPTTSRSKHTKKSNRTPFGRAQTMFAGSPMDIQMIDPSPAPIASLGLSPRHRAVRKPSSLSRNIFASAAAEAPGSKSSPEESDEDTNNFDDDDDDDEFDDLDDIPILTSPTRLKQHGQDPFKALGRPGLLRQRTAPPKQFGQQNLLTAKAASKESAISTIPTFSRPVPGPTTTSPNQRRLSKLPSASALPHVNESSTSPTRKALLPISSTSPTRQAPSVGRPLSRKRVDDLSNTTDLRQPISMNSQMQGRTLVELAQARTGIAVQDFGEKQDLKRPLSGGDSDNERRNSPPVWDPEQDEMPSPFLDRRSRHNLITASTASGPGFRHLR